MSTIFNKRCRKHGGQRRRQEGRSSSGLAKFVFWLHPDSVGGAFPLRLFSQVWRQASGGTGYQFTYFLILRRAFWPPRKRVEGYEAEAQFPQYVIQIILTIRNVISFEWVKLIFINP